MPITEPRLAKTSVMRGIDSGLPTDVEAHISFRAYELYFARGCEPGYDLNDWFRAEQEVMGQTSDATTLHSSSRPPHR